MRCVKELAIGHTVNGTIPSFLIPPILSQYPPASDGLTRFPLPCLSQQFVGWGHVLGRQGSVSQLFNYQLLKSLAKRAAGDPYACFIEKCPIIPLLFASKCGMVVPARFLRIGKFRFLRFLNPNIGVFKDY
jgi:hypothetical protein